MPSSSQSSAVNPSVEEVRVAMALNGGVSLAVWMGGCAVELDAARRAHGGPEEMAFGGYDPGATGRTASRRVYNALCEAFGRRLSVDILTGASAGGINGSLLAAAMVWGRRLHPELVRGRWLELGDLERILHRPGKRDPRSLMDGDLFHRELLRTFRLIRGEALEAESDGDAALRASAALPGDDEGGGGTPPQPPWLEVTMTDVIGTELTFLDEWRLPLVAREHAPRFRFREACEYTVPALAAAARTSASFPIAFEPWLVQGEAATRARLDPPTFGIDGGLLDNAPIRAALDMVPFRTATSRVRRYACYVNADPPQPEPPGDAPPAAPGVDDVLGYVVNLPRTAPFVRQLYAVREAVNRAPVTQAIVSELLSMDLGALEETANALLPAYRRRRTARSVEELVGDPARARQVRDLLDPEGGELTWIPSEDRIEPPTAESWEWGIRPAQRIVYLLLDMLRGALERAGAGERVPLLAMRERLEARIAALEEVHRDLVRLVGPLLEATAFDDAGTVFAARREAVFAEAKGAGEDALAFPDRAGAGEQAGAFAALFEPPPRAAGDDAPAPAPLEIFLRRVLAIEVVRRALADDIDVDTGQELRFVQLTPAAPTPILSTEPLGPEPPPAPAERKLTGVGLGHFAGFYRRAWRANDFMWGRLDAAARIVDLLLDRPPSAGGGRDAARRAEILAEAVLPPSAGAESRWLAQEALAEYEIDGEPLVDPPGEEPLPAPALREEMQIALQHELGTAGGDPPAVTDLPLTRAVCARAAQLEAIRDELPILVEESAADGERGSSGRPLELGTGLRAQIEALRGIQAPPPEGAGEDEAGSLPKRLTGPGEAVSRLGLGTISRAVRVGISMAESTVAPLAGLLAILRVPAFAIAGVVARGRLHRLATGLAFAAAAVYLTSRIVTAQAQAAPFSDAWSLPVLLSLVAALLVVPAIAVPALQAWKGIEGPLNALRAGALALSGGLAAALLALWSKGGGLDLEQVLLAPGAENPCETVIVIALAASAGLVAVRLPFAGDLAKHRPLAGPTLSLLAIAVSLALIVASSFALFGEIDGGWWRTVSILLALPGAPLAAAWCLRPWRRM